MICKRCSERGKTWNGDDPVCAFPDGVFDPDGWNCATTNELRDLIDSRGFEIPLSDQRIAIIPTTEIEYYDQDQWLCLYVSWYKNRGRTEALWLLDEVRRPKLPTLKDVEKIIEFYSACRRQR